MTTGGLRHWAYVICLIAALLLTGCAEQKKSIIILLPEEGKPPGEVTVITPDGSQVMNRPWQAVEISGSGVSAQPSAPITTDEAAMRGVFAEAMAAMPAPPIRYILYFIQNSTVLTSDSRLLLPEVIKAIKTRHPAELSVVGHTDTMGTGPYNYQLGLSRAKAVTEELKSLGAAPIAIETSSHGKADLLIKTGDQVSEQRNRRVEVTIR